MLCLRARGYELNSWVMMASSTIHYSTRASRVPAYSFTGPGPHCGRVHVHMGCRPLGRNRHRSNTSLLPRYPCLYLETHSRTGTDPHLKRPEMSKSLKGKYNLSWIRPSPSIFILLSAAKRIIRNSVDDIHVATASSVRVTDHRIEHGPTPQ